MKPVVIAVTLVCSVAFVPPAADERVSPGADPVQAALGNLIQAAMGTDWQSEMAARKELASLGLKAAPKVAETARSHQSDRVRRSCYELLTDAFATDASAVDTAIQYGLRDRDARIRYHCAFLLGDLKIQRAEQALRAASASATGKDDELFRYTVSKSLAQLGQADVLRVLFVAVSDDSFMARHVGNIGLKALSGKNLDDFEGYHYGEGAFVDGGMEFSVPFDAIASAEKKALRFHAATAYFKWLKTERPELYENVTYRKYVTHRQRG
jgi:hypothetical protein